MTGFKGRAYRKEGQSGLFFCCLQMSEVFYVSEELRYLLVVLDKSQKKMDPTEEAFVAQVREASIAQVTHVKPLILA